jgi:fucose 4-O-acetylase-like acetyltransferase
MSDVVSDIGPRPMADSGAGRLAWLDYAKAFAIALVVFGHASRSVERTDGLVWGDGLRLADQLIYTFHIPLFFVLAGYAASLVAGRGIAAQARGLFWGVAVPYVVWTVVWVGLKVSFPGSVNEAASWSDLATALWRPVEHMWFLQHLFIARLFWIGAERAGAGGVTGGSAIVLGLFAVASWMATVEGDPKSVTALLGNIAFVGAGAIWVPVLLKYARDPRLIAVAGLAFAGWGILASSLEADELGLRSFAAALLASLVVLKAVWYMSPPVGRFGRTMAFVGEASLAIYVTHSIVIALVRALLQKAGVLDEALLITLGTVLGLVVPAAIYWVALAASARTGWPLARLAGLGTATRSYYLKTTRPAVVAAQAATAGS